MDTDMLLPLAYLDRGDCAEVAEVSGEPGWIARMAELGVRPGGRLEVLQPGCPCLLQVGGTRLILRADIAANILVRPTAALV